MGHRLFVGCPVPEEAAQALTECARRTLEGADVRLIKPEDMHVTLLFYPNVSDDERTRLAELTRQVSWRPLNAKTGELRSFSRSALAITLEVEPEGRRWLQDSLLRSSDSSRFDLEAPLAQMSMMLGAVERQRRWRAQEYDRPLALHVTVARLKHGWRGALPGGLAVRDLVLDRLCLYESHLSSDGARYEVLSEAKKGPDAECSDPLL